MATNSKSGRALDANAPQSLAAIRLSEVRLASAHVDGQSKFRLVAELGRGGMGNVYLAVVSGPAGFNKLQVVKRLRPELAEDHESVTMFLDEARLAARLNHPNVVQTNEVGEEDGHYFIAMEYLEGQSLDQIVRRARTTSDSVPMAIHLRVLCDALAGLHHAHELHDFDGAPLGLVHRDVTPQNIFITYDGISKLLDFGIAKAASSAHETRAGTFKGKCAYMPPEQIIGHAIDRRADIFSVGAVLWQAATGERLWKGESDVKIFHSVMNGEIPSPRTLKPDVPAKLEAICMRALAPRRDDRYSNALEMQAALEEFMEESGLKATDRDVARFVGQLFAVERANMKAAVDSQLREISRASESNKPVPIPMLTGSPDDPASLSSKRGMSNGMRSGSAAQGSLTAGVVVGSTAQNSVPPAPSKRGRVALAGLALAVALGVVAFQRIKPQGSPTSAAQPPAAEIVRAPVAAAAPSTEYIALHIAATPASARLFVDDAPLGANPVDSKFVRDGATHLVRAEAAGYRTATQLVGFKSDQVKVALTLEASESPSPGARRPAAPPPAPAPARPATAPAAAAPRAAPGDLPAPRASAPPRSIDTADPWQ